MKGFQSATFYRTSCLLSRAFFSNRFRITTEDQRNAALKNLLYECLKVNLSEAATDGQFITVANTSELIRAIRSDATIILEPGVYNITKGYEVKNNRIKWNDYFDGLFPVIKSVSNLILRGRGKVEILIDPKYGWVMEFQACQNIMISNITFGHTTAGFCIGGEL